MNLRQVIARLEAEHPDMICPQGFRNPHSYRDHYRELSFAPSPNVTVAEMLDWARSAIGATYQGWKGGDYIMSLDTPCHFSPEGECDDLGDVPEAQLEAMLAAGAVPGEGEPAATRVTFKRPDLPEDWKYYEIETMPCVRNDVDYRFAMLSKSGDFIFGVGQDNNGLRNPLAHIPAVVIEYLFVVEHERLAANLVALQTTAKEAQS